MRGTGFGTLRVRMYRVGLGDCFLVTLPTADGERHVLVDCGVHEWGDLQVMDQVVGDIADTTGRRLSVVVASNVHADHVSGFGRFAAEFGRFSIGEVWLPWTEAPRDREAAKVRERREELARRLGDHYGAVGAAEHVSGAVANLAGTDAPLRALRSGFGTGATVRYLAAGETLRCPAGVAGLSAKVLGPDRATAAADPATGQRFFAMGAGGRAAPVNAVAPFAPKWRADGPAAAALSREDAGQLRAFADAPLDDLAFALDASVDNASLSVLLTLGGQHLLFPGDTLSEGWRRWLDGDDAADDLGQVTFLKVGHHGSAQATPPEALERMPEGGFAAMVSTQGAPWPSMPSEGLMAALERKTGQRLVRSDSLPLGEGPDGPPMYALPEGFRRGPFWYDYEVEVATPAP